MPTGIIGGLASTGMGLIKDQFKPSADELMQKQYQYEADKMGLQAKLNKEQALYSQELAKQMWEYTNYENQVEHMKNAGLNPALLYGGGAGSGGTASGAGTAQGVSQGTSQAVAMGLQAKQIDLQQRVQEAEITKTLAEAAKISGVDTEESKSRTALNKTEEAFKQVQSALTEETTEMTKQQTEEIKSKIEKYQAETENILLNNEITEKTKETTINSAAQNYVNLVYDGVNKVMGGKLTEKQIEYINEEIKWYSYGVATGRISAEAAKEQAKNAANRITEEVKKWNKELDQKDTEILQQWTQIGVNGLNSLLDQIKSFMPQKMTSEILETIIGNGKKTVTTTTKK